MSDESGESLIELIVAMAILGTTMVTIVGGFLGLAKISGLQRDQAKAFTALTAASEYAKNRPCAAPTVHNCSVETTVPSSTVPHDSDTTVSVSTASTNADTGLTQFLVTVKTGVATFTNVVVVR